MVRQMGKMKEINTMLGSIKFTPVKYASLKKAYKEAKHNNKEMFVFEGHDILVSYAKYMIEYLKWEYK